MNIAVCETSAATAPSRSELLHLSGAGAPQQAASTSRNGQLFRQQMAHMRAQDPGGGAAQASDLGTPGQLDRAASQWVQQNLFGQAPAASGGQPIGVQQLIRPD